MGRRTAWQVEDLHELAADGSEIGGHTAGFVDLTALGLLSVSSSRGISPASIRGPRSPAPFVT